ncbi:DNA topoisomerase 6 subunit B [Orobanche gracilis]
MAKPSSSNESLSSNSSSFSREEETDDDDDFDTEEEFAARVVRVARLAYSIAKKVHLDGLDGLESEETILRNYRRHLGLEEKKEHIQQIREEEADHNKFVADSTKYSEDNSMATEDKDEENPPDFGVDSEAAEDDDDVRHVKLDVEKEEKKEHIQQIREEEADHNKFVADSTKYSEDNSKAAEDDDDVRHVKLDVKKIMLVREDLEWRSMFQRHTALLARSTYNLMKLIDGSKLTGDGEEFQKINDCLIIEETLLQNYRRRAELVGHNDMFSPISLQALDMPAHNMQAREQQEKKRKLTRYIPDTADAVNNIVEEMTLLPASKKICYVHDDDEEILTKVLGNMKNLIARETLIELAKHAEQMMQAHEHPERKPKFDRHIASIACSAYKRASIACSAYNLMKLIDGSYKEYLLKFSESIIENITKYAEQVLHMQKVPAHNGKEVMIHAESSKSE